MNNNQCIITGCRTTIHHRTPTLSLHPCPTNLEMRSKWMKIMKSKCHMIDWNKSKICSKHFESKYFDSQRNLKENAIPTMFPVNSRAELQPKTKIDRLLNILTQAELSADIKNTLARMKEPSNLDVFVNDNLKCKADAPMEAKLWLMVKKQEHLNNRLNELVIQTKKHVEILQSNMEESKAIKKENEHTIESLKYIAKCLQEKQATLEEQIEILTAVEARF